MKTLNGTVDEARKASAGALYREAQRIITDSKQHYVPANLGVLKGSGFVKKPVYSGKIATVELGFGGGATTYAVYVHEGIGPAVGRPAFFPPVEPIRKWAIRKGLPPEAAFPIARAIGQRGIAPSKYLEKPLNAARTGMTERLAADAKRAFEAAMTKRT